MYNLCILTSHFYPIKSSCSDLFRDLIKTLLKEDFNITIITISGTKTKIKSFKTKKLNYIGIKNPNLKSPNNYLRAIGDIISIIKLKNYSQLELLASSSSRHATQYTVNGMTLSLSSLIKSLHIKHCP